MLFGEWLPEKAIEEAFALVGGVDLMFCIGASLEVHPVAQLTGVTQANGGTVALITQARRPGTAVPW